MSADPWINMALDAPLENFEVFLTTRGFTCREDLGGRAFLYEAPNGSPVILPMARSFDDYPLRISNLVDSLSLILDEDRDNIARLIASVGYDIFKIRTEIGRQSFSVDLDAALDLLHNGYAIIDYSAVYATSNKSVSYIQGRRTNEVANYLDAVRMGQTEPGSFVLTLLLPIIGRKDLAEDRPSILSLGQRVSDAIVEGLQSSKAALDAYHRTAKARSGDFTANFVTALAEIVKHSPRVEMGVDQKTTRKSERISFSRGDEEPLRELAENLTPKVKSWSGSLSGTVVNVTEPRGQKSGTFVLEALVEGSLKNVRIAFSRDIRKIIIKAFDEKADLKLSARGMIVKSYSGRYSLERPQDIKLMKRGQLA